MRGDGEKTEMKKNNSGNWDRNNKKKIETI
jgi:hypothetical protein